MKHHCSKYHPHLLRTFLKITQQLFHWISPRHYSPLFFSRSIVVTSLKQNLSRYRQTIDFRQSITGTNAQETRSKMIGCSLGTRNAFQVERTRPNAKDFFPLPLSVFTSFSGFSLAMGGERERGVVRAPWGVLGVWIRPAAFPLAHFCPACRKGNEEKRKVEGKKGNEEGRALP